MATIPKRVEDRLIAGLKKFQTVLTAAKSRDVNESDLVVIRRNRRTTSAKLKSTNNALTRMTLS